MITSVWKAKEITSRQVLEWANQIPAICLKMWHQNTVASCPSENHSFYSRLDALHFFHSGRNLIRKIIVDMFIKKKIQFSPLAHWLIRVRLCGPTDCSTPGLPVHHQFPVFTQTHVRWISDAIQPSHPLSSPSPPTFSLSQHQGLSKWISSSHQVAKVLQFQLQHPASREYSGLISFRIDWLDLFAERKRLRIQ